MSRPVWSSDLTDLAAISATQGPSAGYRELYPTGGPTWDAVRISNAYPRTLPTSQPVSGDGERDMSPYMTSPIVSAEGRTNYHVAPDAYAPPHAALPAEPLIDLRERTNRVPKDFPPTYSANVAGYSPASPSATSEHASMYPSSSSSDASDSLYPLVDPPPYTALSNSSSYVAQPLLSTTGDYLDYFANPKENLCVFADITAQLDDEPESPTSASPVPTTPSAVASHTAPNYSGPIRNTIVNMSTDKNGIVWIVFPYSKNKQIKNHTVRCDVDKVPPGMLKKEIKSVSAAVRPLTLKITLTLGLSNGWWDYSW